MGYELFSAMFANFISHAVMIAKKAFYCLYLPLKSDDVIEYEQHSLDYFRLLI